jgi:phosphoglucosamine mutase
MMRQLFGTDGMRGVAGKPPLDPRTVCALGAALGEFASALAPSPEVVIGMDTRESSPWIAEHVAGGLAQHGVTTRFAGLITTPGVAWLTRTGPYVAGVMISASHNPYQDNGIKVISHSGYKFPDADEHALETGIFKRLENGFEPQRLTLAEDPGLDKQYLDYLSGTMQVRLDGLRMVVDTANGAASHLAPALFERLGAEVHSIGASPNGKNINLNCGALHVEQLQRKVVERKAAVGVAFDGDADRAMLVAASGRLVDGDGVLWIAGRAMAAQGKLGGPDGRPTVVATVMSNLGLEKALQSEGIALLRTPVGDKYVLEEMVRSGCALGGEQSGHVIFLEHATTGDGMLTALRTLEIMQRSGQTMDALVAGMSVFPQRLVNVRVAQRRPLAELPQVTGEIRLAEEAFAGNGRVLVRFSGTEHLCRVMVEGNEREAVDHWVERIAEVLKSELG